jgi:hypothetical protein
VFETHSLFSQEMDLEFLQHHHLVVEVQKAMVEQLVILQSWR